MSIRLLAAFRHRLVHVTHDAWQAGTTRGRRRTQYRDISEPAHTQPHLRPFETTAGVRLFAGGFSSVPEDSTSDASSADLMDADRAPRVISGPEVGSLVLLPPSLTTPVVGFGAKTEAWLDEDASCVVIGLTFEADAERLA